MSIDLLSQFAQFLNINLPKTELIVLDAAIARKLLCRIDSIRLHAHTYSFTHNLNHGSRKPIHALEFAYQHKFRGLNIHVDDGGEYSLNRSSSKQLAQFKTSVRHLHLIVYLETSSTEQANIDQVIQKARSLGIDNIRVYSRYEGKLSQVMALTVADLVYMAEQADRYNLYFDFEQHEEFKSTEIVQMLIEVDHPRIRALFDFTNMINAYEQPLSALKTMAPYVRQVRLKGAKIINEGNGYGQVGVIQGSVEDEMSYARMLYELLMLGETEPQVICFALEQEVNYYSPDYRYADESDNPFIPYKEPSQTPFDAADAQMVLLNEMRWATNQVNFIKSWLAELR